MTPRFWIFISKIDLGKCLEDCLNNSIHIQKWIWTLKKGGGTIFGCLSQMGSMGAVATALPFAITLFTSFERISGLFKYFSYKWKKKSKHFNSVFALCLWYFYIFKKKWYFVLYHSFRKLQSALNAYQENPRKHILDAQFEIHLQNQFIV